MTQPFQSPNPEIQQRVMWILWASLLLSLVIYVVVALVAGPTARPADGMSHDLAFLKWIFLAIAFGETGAILMLSRTLVGKLPLLNFFVVRWALAESIGVFGLVLYFVGEALTFLLVFIGWGAALLLLLAPTHSAIQRAQR
jgi:hypothetical protein